MMSATLPGRSRVKTTLSMSIAGSWSLSPMHGVVYRPNVPLGSVPPNWAPVARSSASRTAWPPFIFATTVSA